MEAAQAAVAAAEALEKRFFDSHTVENAKDKGRLVDEAVAHAVALLDPLFGESKPSVISGDVQLLFLKGKVMNIPQSYNSEAESLLSKAVKLDPSLVDGWNELGTCVWKKGDLNQAKTCFKGAMKVGDNKESMQHLSMLLRSLPGSDLEKANNINESLELAKQASKIDVTDGHSWFVLGNAYLALFFSQMETTDHIKKALVAYRQAETDRTEATNNPDLHHNSATVHEYQEDYDRAIEQFQLSSLLDPEWPTPKVAVQKIRARAAEIQALVTAKGQLDAKKLAGILGLLKEDGAEKFTASAKLAEGINDMKATRITIVKVFPVAQPQCYVGVDEDGAFMAVTIYNMAPDAIANEDTVIVPEPFFRKVTINKMSGAGAKEVEYAYPSIRVDNPVTLFVNGSALGEEKLAKSSLAITSTTGAGAGSSDE